MLSKKFKKELKIFIILVIVAFTVKGSIVEVYVVPTPSMENEILVGDLLFGNKWIYGMRTPTWLGIPYTRTGFDLPWKRLPVFKNLQSGNVVIFEYPRDPFQKYVKRCIGTPGDQVKIELGKIFINDKEMQFPENGQFSVGIMDIEGYSLGENKKIVLTPQGTLKGEAQLYPLFSGNQDNIREFTVPYKGMKINFEDVKNWKHIITLLIQDGNKVELENLERQYTIVSPYDIVNTYGIIKHKIMSFFITNPKKWEHYVKKDKYDYFMELRNNHLENNLYNPWLEDLNREELSKIIYKDLRINGEKVSDLKTYSLKYNYYFMMGDNRDQSYDSRFWGFVPEYQILGTPVFGLLNLSKFKLKFKLIN